jgi:hypothetical protein
MRAGSYRLDQLNEMTEVRADRLGQADPVTEAMQSGRRILRAGLPTRQSRLPGPTGSQCPGHNLNVATGKP